MRFTEPHGGFAKAFLLTVIIGLQAHTASSQTQSNDQYAWSMTATPMSEAEHAELERQKLDRDCYLRHSYVIQIFKGTKLINRNWSCSTYDIEVKAVTDAKGNPYFLEAGSEGYGTSARERYLDVTIWDGVYFRRVQRIDISQFVAPYVQYIFDYEITTPPEGGLVIDFTLRQDGDDFSDFSGGAFEKPALVPKHMSVRVSYD